MADISEGPVAMEVGKADVVDMEVKAGEEEDASKGLKRKLEEAAATEEPKLNGNVEEKNGGETNGHSAEAGENGHKNGTSPAKKAKTEEEGDGDKTEVTTKEEEAVVAEAVVDSSSKAEVPDAIVAEVEKVASEIEAEAAAAEKEAEVPAPAEAKVADEKEAVAEAADTTDSALVAEEKVEDKVESTGDDKAE